MTGVAVTTTDPIRLNRFLENFRKVSPELELFIFEDKELKGIRYAKNECLKKLSDCDYIYLFDDDCWPTKERWYEFTNSKLDRWNHINFNLPRVHSEKFRKDDILVTYNCGGVFMGYTKKVLETAGYMDKRYTGHGWEHLGYSYRIYRHGLTLNPYLSPIGIEEYLYAEDYVNPNIRKPTEQTFKNEQIFLEEAANLYPKYVKF